MIDAIMLEDGRLLVPFAMETPDGGIADGFQLIGPDDELYNDWLPFVDNTHKYSVNEIREAFGDIPGL